MRVPADRVRPPTDQEGGHVLSRWMAANGVTQSNLAEQIGYSRAAVSLVANGRAIPARAFALAIERATNGAVRASVLMGVASTPAVLSRAAG